jgi:hypothetical protein
MSDLVLPLDAFVRTIGIHKNSPHALFLGAGASITSGVPSANTCLWEWKQRIFLTNHPGLEEQFSELSLESVKTRIQEWLDSQGIYPRKGENNEYSTFIEVCYPIPESRRAYFSEKVKLAKPFTGYKLLCLLAEAELFRSVWSTNFDSLTPKAANDFNIVPIEVGIDSQNRLPRLPAKGELLYIAMHGDYRYDALMNTAQELLDQEAHLREQIINHAKDNPFIICGYSGRDASIMEALNTAYSQSGTGALYWCGHGDRIPELVKSLLLVAREAGRTAYFVPTRGFDDVMVSLARFCLKDDLLGQAQQIISTGSTNNTNIRKPLEIDDLPVCTLLKSNAFELECPSEVFAFEPKQWPSKKVWRWLKEKTEGQKVLAVPYKRVLCLGLLDTIKDIFKDDIKGTVERVPVDNRDLYYENGAMNSLMKSALVDALAFQEGLSTDGRDIIWETSAYEQKSFEGQKLQISRAAIIFIRSMSQGLYLVIKPSIHITNSAGEEVCPEIAKALKNKILSSQYNKQFNQEMDYWRKKLFAPDRQVTFEYPPNCGSTFRFKIRTAPVFSAIGQAGQNRISILPNMQPLISQKGIIIQEPSLVFLNKSGSGLINDIHPIRGLVQARPYDFNLTLQGLAPSISLGVICPRNETIKLKEYLHQSQVQHAVPKTMQDHLLDYPGFNFAYGTPLEIPTPGESGWVTCPEPNTELNAKEGSLELARYINSAVSQLESTFKPSVILVFIPDRWNHWHGFETEDERFDLHDFVKAYSVQTGVSTQFLREDTLTDPYPCRVWWWLSLALYAKARRTPWVLDSLAPNTAFVGLGFSLNSKAKKGEQVVLGCSHLYNSRGEGLQFRLGKVENPIIKNGNPFMSKEDARRTGEIIRQLFFDAKGKLPTRVVLHKLTPFKKDEREGLMEGLEGVSTIEMLEIYIDSALRYVSSVYTNGKFNEDDFPVRRGSVLQLNDFTALLWVHGVTDAVKSGWRYYLGKRRIPAPLVITRHAGNSDIRLIAQELLGLSKMDLNSGDMYARLPATIFSSRSIARIGSLLNPSDTISYDYRLFI